MNSSRLINPRNNRRIWDTDSLIGIKIITETLAATNNSHSGMVFVPPMKMVILGCLYSI